MKQLIKKSLATVLFALPGVAAFAASNNGTESNSSTMSYLAVIGFFAAVVGILFVPFGKVDQKSILG